MLNIENFRCISLALTTSGSLLREILQIGEGRGRGKERWRGRGRERRRGKRSRGGGGRRDGRKEGGL